MRVPSFLYSWKLGPTTTADLMRDHIYFLANFIRHPRLVGSVAPSSKQLGNAMLADMEVDRARTVVELGPGTGAFTRVILKAIRPETRYVALELNRDFAGGLEREFPDVHIVNDSAEMITAHLEVLGERHADCIFCGLPWASFGPDLQRRIMTSVVDALPPGGRFATFAYVHAAWFPTARRFHRLLKSRFSAVACSPIVWCNVPPAFIYRCTK